jgi:Mg2+/citrate symporter
MFTETDAFSAAALGAVAHLMFHLKRFQPHRVHLFAAVTDCRMIQFLRAEGTKPEALTFSTSRVLPLLDKAGAPASGLRTLLALLSDRSLSVMPELPWGKTTLKVDRYLGAGSSACVFSAQVSTAGPNVG